MKHVDVVCAIIKKNNKYFCCQRGKGKSLSYKWEFPGGKIEKNETKEEALIREIKEELNSIIEIIKFIGISEHKYFNIENPFSITMHAYLCELKNGSLELSEHINSKWCTVDELKLLDFAEADIPLFELLF